MVTCEGLLCRYILISFTNFCFLLDSNITLDFCSLNLILYAVYITSKGKGGFHYLQLRRAIGRLLAAPYAGLLLHAAAPEWNSAAAAAAAAAVAAVVASAVAAARPPPPASAER